MFYVLSLVRLVLCQQDQELKGASLGISHLW